MVENISAVEIKIRGSFPNDGFSEDSWRTIFLYCPRNTLYHLAQVSSAFYHSIKDKLCISVEQLNGYWGFIFTHRGESYFASANLELKGNTIKGWGMAPSGGKGSNITIHGFRKGSFFSVSFYFSSDRAYESVKHVATTNFSLSYNSSMNECVFLGKAVASVLSRPSSFLVLGVKVLNKIVEDKNEINNFQKQFSHLITKVTFGEGIRDYRVTIDEELRERYNHIKIAQEKLDKLFATVTTTVDFEKIDKVLAGSSWKFHFNFEKEIIQFETIEITYCMILLGKMHEIKQIEINGKEIDTQGNLMMTINFDNNNVSIVVICNLQSPSNLKSTYFLHANGNLDGTSISGICISDNHLGETCGVFNATKLLKQ